MHLSPVDMFRTQTNLYSTFDEEGMPILDHAGKYAHAHIHVHATVSIVFAIQCVCTCSCLIYTFFVGRRYYLILYRF